MQPLTVITGASGYIGGALVERLSPRMRVAGLSRSHAPGMDAQGVEWRKADLFSLAQTRAALAGARYIIYLVHSMQPSARLTQARFEDLDLLMADNVARAAREAGAEQIIFLGGLVPETSGLSRHLRSRLEVERALSAYGVPVTALRAALVVGPHASSLPILVRLVQRLPVMLTPRWTRTLTQPIALEDVLLLIEYSIGNRALYGQHYDIGGPEVLTYREMMLQTARVLGLKRTLLDVPLLTPRLSSAWVTLVSRTPSALVRPLVESLAHPMVVSQEHRLVAPGQRLIPFQEALGQVLKQAEDSPARKKPPARRRPPRTVRSVQRLYLPPDKDALWLSDEYRAWLPRFMRPFLRVERDVQRTLTFSLRWLRQPLLVLSYSEELSTADRVLYYITGGTLARSQQPVRGRLEFRVMPGGRHALTAIHDFEPRLPWRLYTQTQARVHMFVMSAFGRHLRRQARSAQNGHDAHHHQPDPGE